MWVWQGTGVPKASMPGVRYRRLWQVLCYFKNSN